MLKPVALSFLTLSPVNKITIKHIAGLDNTPNISSSQYHYRHLCESFNSKNLVSDLIDKQIILGNQQASALSAITNGKVVNGLVKLDCAETIKDENLQLLKSYAPVLSFYLYPTLHSQHSSNSLSELKINPLTPRQRQVIAGFIEGKTNHELAVELGFSISTIRHETMAIFKLLGASDRKEAAKIAQESSLI